MLGNLVFGSIVFDAVVKHQFHVGYELLNIVVNVECQFLFDSSEIHRLLYDIEVIIDVVLARVNWLVEVVSSLSLPTYCQNFLSSLHPRFLLLNFLNS